MKLLRKETGLPLNVGQNMKFQLSLFLHRTSRTKLLGRDGIMQT